MCFCPHHRVIMHVMRLADVRAFAPEEHTHVRTGRDAQFVLPEKNAIDNKRDSSSQL